MGRHRVHINVLRRLAGADAVSISLSRLALSLPFLLVMARIRTGTWITRLTPRGIWVLIALGLGMAFYQMTYVLVIERVAISALIGICGAPIFVAPISVVWLGDRFNTRTVVALIIAIIGTVLLVGVPSAIDQDINRSRPGRKSWMFSDTVAGAKAGAVIYSLMLNCRVCGFEPHAYLLGPR